jgi:hypothetical protein
MIINKLTKTKQNKKDKKKKLDLSLFKLACQIYDLVVISR